MFVGLRKKNKAFKERLDIDSETMERLADDVQNAKRHSKTQVDEVRTFFELMEFRGNFLFQLSIFLFREWDFENLLNLVGHVAVFKSNIFCIVLPS